MIWFIWIYHAIWSCSKWPPSWLFIFSNLDLAEPHNFFTRSGSFMCKIINDRHQIFHIIWHNSKYMVNNFHMPRIQKKVCSSARFRFEKMRRRFRTTLDCMINSYQEIYECFNILDKKIYYINPVFNVLVNQKKFVASL